MEKFFQVCSFFDEEIEIKELLLRRYHTLSFINDMDVIEFAEFCGLAKKKEREERMYMQWCAMLPTLREYMTFEEFRDMQTGANIDTRPAAVIIAEIKEAHEGK